MSIDSGMLFVPERTLYLNHAGTSWPKPPTVVEATQRAMAASPADWPRMFDEAHEAIATYFGVTQRDQLLLTPGCTSALAVAIGDTFIADGKRILTSSWEHHALHRPLLLRARNGQRVDYIPPTSNENGRGTASPLDLDWLQRELHKQDIGLIAITAACNVTGELLPYEEVIQLAHQFDVPVLIDAAQIVGWQRLDLTSLGADFVAFGGHKGLQAPWGIGGLYISETAPMECASAGCELPAVGRSVEQNRPRPSYCDVGSVDQVALAGLHAAVSMLQREDASIRLNNAREQIQRIREALLAFPSVQLFESRESEQGMPSLAFAIDGFTSSQVAIRFEEHGLIVGSGLHCSPLAHQTLGTSDRGLVRISVGVSQPDDQVDEAIARIPPAIEALRI